MRFDYDTTTIRRYHDAFDYDGSDRNYDSTAIRLRSDYDVSRTPASIRRDSTRAKINMSIFRRSRFVVVSQSNRNCDISFTHTAHLPGRSSSQATLSSRRLGGRTTSDSEELGPSPSPRRTVHRRSTDSPSPSARPISWPQSRVAMRPVPPLRCRSSQTQ